MSDFIIQHNLLSASMLEDVRLAVQGLPHTFVGLIPFSREITSNEPIIGLDHIPYGSTSFVETAEELGWSGLCFDRDKQSYFEAAWNRDDMLNGGTILAASMALPFIKQLEGDLFMRPSDDLKKFTGSVFTPQEAEKFLTDAMSQPSSAYEKIKDDDLIVIGPVRQIVAEWRWFIIGGKVVDGSWYRLNGELVKTHVNDRELTDEAQEFSDGWLPHENCVMDLCELADGSKKVIEFNCINGSGFYQHDVKKIFHAWYRATH